MLLATCALLTLAAFYALSLRGVPAERIRGGTELAVLPELHGDFWFRNQHLRRFTPALRVSLLNAIKQGDKSVAGAPLDYLISEVHQVTEGDLERFYQELGSVVETIRQSGDLSGKERDLISHLDLLPPSHTDQYQGKLLDFANFLIASEPTEATDFHLLAAVQQELRRKRVKISDSPSGQAAEEPTPDRDLAIANYKTALKMYKEAEQWEMYALCACDYSRLLIDYRRSEAEVLSVLREACNRVDSPTLLMMARCLEALAQTKLSKNHDVAITILQRVDRQSSLGPKHPLRSELLLNQGMVQLTQFQLSESIESVTNCRELLSEASGRPAGPYAVRTLLWAFQMEATARHFLGEHQHARAIYETLLGRQAPAEFEGKLQLAQAISPRFLEVYRDRIPNLTERLAESYLFAPSPNFAEAIGRLHESQDVGVQLKFESDHRAPYISRVKYKRCLALLLNQQVREASDEFKIADLNTQSLIAEGIIKPEQHRVYSNERNLVAALLAMAEDDPETQQEGFELLNQLVTEIEPSKASSASFDIFLFAITELANSQTDDQQAYRTLALRVQGLAQRVRPGGSRHSDAYLQPYLETMLEGLQASRLHSESNELNYALESIDDLLPAQASGGESP